MSRYTTVVSAQTIYDALASVGMVAPALLRFEKVEVAHGYDRPCSSYFVDFFDPDDEWGDPITGFWYGMIGLGVRITREEMRELWNGLAEQGVDGAHIAWLALTFDRPY